MPKISRNEAAKLLGVSADTLRRWEEEGLIEPERTEGGHRRYDVATLLKQSERDGKTICYARVSTRPQKADKTASGGACFLLTVSSESGIMR